MSRSERWTEEREIRRRLSAADNPRSGVGPLLKQAGNRFYIDDSQGHVAVYGNTGMGKTQCFSLPLAKRVAEKRQSGIFIDSKGELYHTIGRFFTGYDQLFCVDFSDPMHSPTKWNPLLILLLLFLSENPEDRDMASTMLADLGSGTYPPSGPDPFWSISSADYLEGLIQALFETAPEDQVNLDSVAVMMEQSEKKIGATTLLKAFYDYLPEDSLARRTLATYVTAPNDTRASIHSVASSGMKEFSRSRGLIEMMKNDTLDLMNLDVSRPFALFIILPEETDAYNMLAGLLVSQVIGYLMRMARKHRGNRLPVRVHILLEELGSVGKGVPNLHMLMTQGRSKNIRMYLVLQSRAQLDDVYGREKAQTIDSCVKTTIGFSSNSWEMLDEWSRKCGDEWVLHEGHLVKDRMIQTSKLAAMPEGVALIMVDNRFKFVSRLPFFYEMYPDIVWKAPKLKPKEGRATTTLDFEGLVNSLREKKVKALVDGDDALSRYRSSRMAGSHFLDDTISAEELEREIDRMLAELELEEKEETDRKQREEDRQYRVLLIDASRNRMRIGRIIASHMGITVKNAVDCLDRLPAELAFGTREEAMRFIREVNEAGGRAILAPP